SNLTGGQLQGAERQSHLRSIEWNESEIVLADRGESRLVATRDLVGEVIKSLILLQRASECNPCLHPCVGWIRYGAERIHSLEVAIAQISVHVAVKIVGAGAGDDIDDSTGGASIFCRVVVGDDLEFLYRFLRNRGSYAIHGIVGRVGTIYIYEVGARALTAHVEARGGRCAQVGSRVVYHLRIRQREIDIVPAIDWQIVDAPLPDRVSGRAAR